jgi:hypothetical protein
MVFNYSITGMATKTLKGALNKMLTGDGRKKLKLGLDLSGGKKKKSK